MALIISIFLGSVRSTRNGKRVFDWIARETKKRGHTVHLIDPFEHKDLLVLRDRFKDIKEPSADLKKVQQWVDESDAFIAISPEYNHGYSGALKNALDCFTVEYHFKCFGIVTYSDGNFGGIRAAEQLRAVCADLKAPAIPASVPISKVNEALDENGNLVDKQYEKRLEKFLAELEWYGAALKTQREKGISAAK